MKEEAVVACCFCNGRPWFAAEKMEKICGGCNGVIVTTAAFSAAASASCFSAGAKMVTGASCNGCYSFVRWRGGSVGVAR
ncbi:hypothetical protein DEO72_LG6g1157 [Vigna unguiculata]|uniref:Uncharacterized protein n=1 Tax=Vigna unguiculata TaxID=3917 RepID=A0A4D6M9F2_VIGUN|nr:hypothetical protein DEO72_LG6g1157 [Vigna unguiculata]